MKINHIIHLFCFITLTIVFIFYYPSLFYKLKSFDEIVPFRETYLPTCTSLSEMFELISLAGLKQHFEATNTLYSSIISIRCNPLGNLLQMLLQFFLKKKPFFYHFYSLCLHLINTALVFYILNKISLIFSTENTNKYKKIFLITSLSLLWALHPVNIESVLLLTNANIVLSYTFCFLTFYFYLSSIPNDFNFKKISIFKSLLQFIFFLTALFTAEFHFALPLILISYTTAMSMPFIKSFFTSLKSSILTALPLIIASFLYIISFIFSNTGTNITNYLNTTIIERIFWLSPQVLFHFLKLVIFPVKLSIDQTFLVKLGKSLFDPYSIFCMLFVFLLLVFSIISLINSNKRTPFLFLIFFLFFLALLPFSQILAPVYNLASERYLYLPSFMFVFGLSHLLFHLLNTSIKPLFNNIILILLFFTLVIYTTRAYIRTLDWKDSLSLYKAAIEVTDNPLNKAFRYKLLVPQEKIFLQFPEKEVDLKYKKAALNYLKKAIKLFKEEEKRDSLHSPEILKVYGLDPGATYSKAGYLYVHTYYNLNKDHKRALELIKPFTNDLSKLDNAALTFYASILFHNNMSDEAEKVLRYGYKKYPYALRIIYSLCDLIEIKYKDLNEVEKITLKTFHYYPYDTFTILILKRLYNTKGDVEKFAYYSYLYGLRHHSIEDLEMAKKAYVYLNKKDMALKTDKWISNLKVKLIR